MSLFDALPAEVSIYEVSPRDGLQNEAVTVPTTRKVRPRTERVRDNC